MTLREEIALIVGPSSERELMSDREWHDALATADAVLQFFARRLDREALARVIKSTRMDGQPTVLLWGDAEAIADAVIAHVTGTTGEPT